VQKLHEAIRKNFSAVLFFSHVSLIQLDISYGRVNFIIITTNILLTTNIRE